MKKKDLKSLKIPEGHRKTIEEYIEALSKSDIVSEYKVILFGSCARESTGTFSDIDLCIVTSNELSGELIEYLKYDVMDFPPDDITVFTERDFEKYKDNMYSIVYSIYREGVILYER